MSSPASLGRGGLCLPVPALPSPNQGTKFSVPVSGLSVLCGAFLSFPYGRASGLLQEFWAWATTSTYEAGLPGKAIA